MSRQNRTPIRIAILGVLLAALVFAVYSSFASESVLQAGDAAPNFQLEQLGGGTITLDDLRGKPVVLNFWGSWCKPCEAEMPELEKQYQKYGDDVAFIGVNIGQTPITVEKFIEQVGVTFPILLDREREITKLYNIGPIPTTYFIDQNGTITDILVVQLTEQMIEEKLAKLLPQER
ncbi:thiol-disulfide oxidoreductase ResA [Brevibacillus humidisoli]|uniref:thiol-disulfide oxidoreductase ResA n=1 Tax=Brevibacillus humidisoli TaxID=2895522 RepID=UPI001E56572E|nr:thiol-disulfide oxidoreductase ResA [Brevibacillus humidisoli]UFJ42834.1 thiol-disulfide oxidoreductase ResA [Brevibacillus humidisoli]